jgi:hypothetical protein
VPTVECPRPAREKEAHDVQLHCSTWLAGVPSAPSTAPPSADPGRRRLRCLLRSLWIPVIGSCQRLPQHNADTRDRPSAAAMLTSLCNISVSCRRPMSAITCGVTILRTCVSICLPPRQHTEIRQPNGTHRQSNQRWAGIDLFFQLQLFDSMLALTAHTHEQRHGDPNPVIGRLRACGVHATTRAMMMTQRQRDGGAAASARLGR